MVSAQGCSGLQVAQAIAPPMGEELSLEHEQLLMGHMTRLRGALQRICVM